MGKRAGGMKEKVRLARRREFSFTDAVNLFTYGTLMFDPIWSRVTGRIHPSITGTLDDYEARKIVGEVFPGLVPAAGCRVNGRIWQEVSPDDIAALDRYESHIYERRIMEVQGAKNVRLECWTYVVRPEFRARLLDEPWQAKEFRERHLPGYLIA